MAEQVATETGDQVTVADFHAAMAAPAGDSPGYSPPPRRPPADPDAPHGRAGDGTPLAPYGLTADGRPKRTPAGRPRKDKDDQARTRRGKDRAPTGAGPGRGPAPAAGEPADYTTELDGLATSVWLAGCTLEAARPYANLWRMHQDAQVAAWNMAARQNATVRGYVERLTGESSFAWVIGVGIAAGQFVIGCLELAKPGNADARARHAAAAEAEFREFVTGVAAAVPGAGDPPPPAPAPAAAGVAAGP